MLHQVDAGVNKMTEGITAQQFSIRHLNTQLSDNVSTSMEVCMSVCMSVMTQYVDCVRVYPYLYVYKHLRRINLFSVEVLNTEANVIIK